MNFRELPKVTPDEVNAYFQAHPDHREMTLEVARELFSDRDDITDPLEISEFKFVPGVGPVAVAIIENISDLEPVWQEEYPELFRRSVWNLKWFGVRSRNDFDEHVEDEVFPLSEIEVQIALARAEAEEIWKDVDSYINGYLSRTFSGSKKFIEVSGDQQTNVAGFEEILRVGCYGYDDGGNDLYAALLRTDDAQLFVGIVRFGLLEARLPVDTEEEGQSIVESIW